MMDLFPCPSYSDQLTLSELLFKTTPSTHTQIRDESLCVQGLLKKTGLECRRLCGPEEINDQALHHRVPAGVWALWNQYLKQILPQEVRASDSRGINPVLTIPQRIFQTQMAAGTAEAKGMQDSDPAQALQLFLYPLFFSGSTQGDYSLE